MPRGALTRYPSQPSRARLAARSSAKLAWPSPEALGVCISAMFQYALLSRMPRTFTADVPVRMVVAVGCTVRGYRQLTQRVTVATVGHNHITFICYKGLMTGFSPDHEAGGRTMVPVAALVAPTHRPTCTAHTPLGTRSLFLSPFA